MTAPLFVWLDLETTGLSPEYDAVLEIGIRITKADLEEVSRFHALVKAPGYSLRRMDAYVTKMHTDNALLAECMVQGSTLADVERSAAAYLQEALGNQKGTLAGNSVHFDRAFLASQMPTLLAFLSHRHLDVSTLRVLAQAWTTSEGPSTVSVHRAQADLDNSIAELRHWRDVLFEAGIGPV